jgi:hypothetical protein
MSESQFDFNLVWLFFCVVLPLGYVVGTINDMRLERRERKRIQAIHEEFEQRRRVIQDEYERRRLQRHLQS